MTATLAPQSDDRAAETEPPEPGPVRPRPRRRTPPRAISPAHRQDWKLAWILVAPALIGFVVFAAYPTLRGVYLSFTDFKVLTPPTWIGLDNFRELAGDDMFWDSLGVTAYFVLLSVIGTIVVAMVTAVILHRLTSSTVVRGMIILPFLISSVVAGVTWSWMLDAQLGIVNILLKELTGETVMFLADKAWAIPSLALISVWKTMGYTTILVFAGLQTIPPPVYEAGRIDGASEIQMFWRITLPLLRPILAMVVILTVIGAFQVFDLVQVTTKGGPAGATNVLQMYIYNKAFSQFDFGYASTMSLALFAMLIVITFIQMRLTRANESDTN